jgi:hypothetical protein
MTRAQEQVQMRADVGKFVDVDPMTVGGGAKGLSNRAFMFAQGPRTERLFAAQGDVHRPARAHGTSEFATAKPDGTAMLVSAELELNTRREQRQLHDSSISHESAWGNIFA